MPLNLTDLTSVTKQAKTWSPKFFDQTLTGVGKTQGALSEKANPINIDANKPVCEISRTLAKRTSHSNIVKTHYIPLSVLTKECNEFMKSIHLRNPDDAVPIGTLKLPTPNLTKDILIEMEPYTMEIQFVSQTSGPDKRIVDVCYALKIYFRDTTSTPDKPYNIIRACDEQDVIYGIKNIFMANNENFYAILYTDNPYVTLSTLSDLMKRESTSSRQLTVDDDAIADYMTHYSLYEHICKLSEIWQTQLDVIIEEAVDNAIDYNTVNHTKLALNEIVTVFKHLEEYNVPLDEYRDIYAMVKQKLNADDVQKLCKYNLNLLLSDTLNNLAQNKAALQSIPTPTKPYTGRASKEQKAAIESTEPLVIVQAGAGTGKSTVILSRIDHMIANGVNPNDITVLSFTNAAADNISAKNPNIHSMTIAKMIDLIYSENFNHALAPIETVINGVEIGFGNTHAIAYEFRKRLEAIAKNEPNGYTNLNNFIESHYDEVIEILNKIGMTSLELEIIICYQQIDTLTEPNTVKSRYLIIDEVQDNAIFEFIYTLKYVNKHKESLYIVGDCSQTLYEFRGSNPRALNILEGSGVFTAYSLQINYRSNQEILDFANITLQKIEANQYARIQLQANSLKTVTEQSFTEKVRFQYLTLSKLADLNTTLEGTLKNDIKPYLDEKLKAGEQVAILTFTRNLSKTIQNYLKEMYPSASMVSLIPEKIYSTTVFSDFIRRYWGHLKFMPIQNTLAIIHKELFDRLKYLVYNEDKSKGFVNHMWTEFCSQNAQNVTNWQKQVTAGHMKIDEYLECVKDAMLKYEIRSNGMKQALVSARNEQNKLNSDNANANFLFSTIHSAKGLEFQNVLLLYRDESMMPEDKKRMYYVAFTRAIQSEYVLAYGTSPHPKIEDDYNTIVDHLHKTNPIPKANSNTTVTLPAGNTPLGGTGTLKVAISEETDNEDADKISDKKDADTKDEQDANTNDTAEIA